MSLKVFHIVFVILATSLSFGIAIWSAFYVMNTHAPVYTVMGILSFILGVVFIFYGKKFFKKLLLLND